jgi:hypothetical protein
MSIHKLSIIIIIIIIIMTPGEVEKRSGISAEAMKQKNLTSEEEVTLEN